MRKRTELFIFFFIIFIFDFLTFLNKKTSISRKVSFFTSSVSAFLFSLLTLNFYLLTFPFGAFGAEWEVADRFTVDGRTMLKSTVTIVSQSSQTYILGLQTPSNGFALFVTTGGNVGIGTTNPQMPLEVTGGIKLGTAAVCNTGAEGTLRYGSGSFEICKSSVWNSLSSTIAWSGAGGNLFLEGGNIAIGTNTANERLTVDGFLSLKAYDSGTAPSATNGYAKIFAIDGIGGKDSYTKLLLEFNGEDGSTNFVDISTAPKTVTNTETYDSYTKLMLHMEGSGNTFTDSTSNNHPVTYGGDVTQTTVEKKFGSKSAYFDGSGDYLSITDSGDWYFNGDFSINCWVKFNVLALSNGEYISLAGQTQSTVYWWKFALGKWAGSYYLNFSWRGANEPRDMNSDYYAFQPGTWYHLAVTRSGSSWRLFINGTQSGSTITDSTAFDNFSGDLEIGRYNSGGSSYKYLDGWIDELAVSNGIARWTADFIPPASEYGKAVLVTSQARFGSAGGEFKGGGEYLSVQSSGDWDFGSGNFTVDLWAKFRKSAGWQHFYSRSGGSDPTDSLQLYLFNGSRFYIQAGGGSVANYYASLSPVPDTWYHLAVVRDGVNIYFFVNGIAQTLNTLTAVGTSALPNPSAPILIGGDGGAGHYFDGGLDEYRISKGIARWTAAFTSPSVPYDNGPALYYKDSLGNVTPLTGNGGGAVSGGSTWGQNGANLYYNSGNVGIGTASPGSGARLAVSGDSGTAYTITAGTSAVYSLAVSTGGDVSLGLSASTVTVAGALKFGDGTVLRSTSSLGSGTGNVSMGSTQTFTGANTFASSFTIINSHADHAFALAVGTDTTYDLVVTTGGRVGIGSTNPVSLLAVNGVVTASTFNAVGTAYQMNGVTVIDSNRAVSVSRVAVSASTDTAFIMTAGTSTAYNFVISTMGYIGIGTTNPKSLFEVAGGIKLGTAAVCDGNSEGTMRYGGGNFEICKSNVWNSLSSTTAWSGSNGNLFLEGGNIAIGTNTANERLTVDGFISLKAYDNGTAPAATAGYGKIFSISGEGGNDAYTKLLVECDGSQGSTLFSDSSPGGKIITNMATTDSYTKLLLHMNGTNGSTIFTDSASGKGVARNGDAHVDTGAQKFGGASGYFDGTGDYLSLADSPDWWLGSGQGAFTIDAWVMFQGNQRGTIASQITDTSHYWIFYVEGSGPHSLSFCIENGSGMLIQFSCPFNYTLGTWNHVALVRKGTTVNDWYMFINGVPQTLELIQGNWNATVADYSGELRIGAWDTSDYNMKGWLDELRISNGIARWTSNFTPASGEYGNPLTVSTSQSKFGGASADFTSGGFLEAAYSDDWNFGTGDFSLDLWAKFYSLPAPSNYMALTSQGNGGGQFWGLYVYNSGSGYEFEYWVYNSVLLAFVPAPAPLSTDTWYHVAFSRNGNTWRLYKDGVQISTDVVTPAAVPDFTQPLYLGVDSGNGQNRFSGWIDEFRISKGVARWTSAFSRPSFPYDSGGGLYYKDNIGNVTNLTGSGGGAASSLWGQNGANLYYNSGNVGIGTASPGSGARLAVSGDSGTAYTITAGTSAAYSLAVSTQGDVSLGLSASTITVAGALRFGDGTVLRSTSSLGSGTGNVSMGSTQTFTGANMFTSSFTIINAHPDHAFSLAVGTDTTYDLVVTTAGRVGIGTAAPAAALDVAGDAVITGNATFAGQVSMQNSQFSVGGSAIALIGGGGGTGNDSYTRLLLHFDGADGSGSFPDNSSGGHVVTAYGSAQVSSSNVKLGTGAALFNGAGAYLTAADSDDWNFGTGDWTVDFWINFNVTNVFQNMLNQYESGANCASFDRQSDGKLAFYFYNNSSLAAYYDTSGSPSINAGMWYHIAYVRSGSAAFIFVNGVSQPLTAHNVFQALPDYAGPLFIGAFHGAGNFLNGRMDELRVSKGMARWTADFTPPASPYGSSSPVKVGIGTSSPAFPLDVNGDSRITGQLIVTGTATVQGNAFSVGNSTLAVWNGGVGIGTTNPSASLHVSGGNIQVGDNPQVTVSSSGFIALPPINAPAASAGRIYYDSNSYKLKLSTGPGAWIEIATGTIVAGGDVFRASSQTFTGANTFTSSFSIINAHPDQQYSLAAGTSAAYNMVISTTGKAGLGTIYPSALLEVRSSQGPGEPVVKISSQDASGMLVVKGDGNVGIGTTAPAYQFEVNGSTPGNHYQLSTSSTTPGVVEILIDGESVAVFRK